MTARDNGFVQKLVAKIDALKQLMRFVACICLVESITELLVDDTPASHIVRGVNLLIGVVLWRSCRFA